MRDIRGFENVLRIPRDLENNTHTQGHVHAKERPEKALTLAHFVIMCT